jgi:hypothetical protein
MATRGHCALTTRRMKRSEVQSGNRAGTRCVVRGGGLIPITVLLLAVAAIALTRGDWLIALIFVAAAAAFWRLQVITNQRRDR